MKLTSVRMRLTLWNIGVLALALTGLALAVQYTVQATLATTVDHNLARAAERALLRMTGRPIAPPSGPGGLPGPSLHLRWSRRGGAPRADLPWGRVVLSGPTLEQIQAFRPLRILDLKGHTLMPIPGAAPGTSAPSGGQRPARASIRPSW